MENIKVNKIQNTETEEVSARSRERALYMSRAHAASLTALIGSRATMQSILFITDPLKNKFSLIVFLSSKVLIIIKT